MSYPRHNQNRNQHFTIDPTRIVNDHGYEYKEGKSSKQFITLKLLKDKVQQSQIQQQFSRTSSWSSDELYKIREEFLAILLILIEIRWSKLDTEFRSQFLERSDRADKDLPFNEQKLEFLDQESRDAFLVAQHAFAPFVIEEGGKEENLKEDRLWPFAETPKLIGQGGFSKVYKVPVPSGCKKIYNAGNQAEHNADDVPLAFKQFHRRIDYKREVKNLESLSSRLTHHDNLTKCMQAVSQGDLYRVFLPFAELGTLQQLFNEPPEAHIKPHLISAFRNLVDGVVHLHEGISDERGRCMYCAHLDLKPENILIFPGRRGKEIAGVWRITDFGISLFNKDSEDRSEPAMLGLNTDPRPDGIKTRGLVGTCCPPELHPPAKRELLGRRADSWSIGCILSILLCYALGGPPCIKTFSNERSYRSEDDFFFGVVCEQPQRQFQFKHCVGDFLRSLIRQHSPDQRWVKKCLFIVRDLLHVSPAKRSDSRKVHQALQTIIVDADGCDPLDPENKELFKVEWDSDKWPVTQSTSRQSRSAIPKAMARDPCVSTSVWEDSAQQPIQNSVAISLQTPRAQPIESRVLHSNDAFQGLPTQAFKKSEDTKQTVVRDEPKRAVLVPPTQSCEASNDNTQKIKPGVTGEAYKIMGLTHNFPDITRPQVKVPWAVKNELDAWFKTSESYSLWISAPTLGSGRGTCRSLQWANALRIKISEWGYHPISYSCEDRGPAGSGSPVLGMALSLNDQLARIETETGLSSQSYVGPHDLEHTLSALNHRLANLSSSSKKPIIFCIIHGLHRFDREYAADSKIFLAALLRGSAIGRLKILLTTAGHSPAVQEFKFTSAITQTHLAEDFTLAYFKKPTYSG